MSDSFRKGRQRLFDLLAQEHGVSALESQVGDIEHCVLSYAQAHAGERKCSECGNGEPDLSLYCVRCLNNDHWHLIDPAKAPEPVAVADKGIINWIDGKQFDHEADLYTQPAVNQQLLEALKEIAEWTERYTSPGHPVSTVARKAIAAAQEAGNE